VHDYEGIEKNPSFSPGESKYVRAFGNKTQALLEGLSAQVSPRSIVYSTACYNHHITEQPGFYTVRTNSGVSEADALGMFLGVTALSSQLVDHCRGFNCGKGCGDSTLMLV